MCNDSKHGHTIIPSPPYIDVDVNFHYNNYCLLGKKNKATVTYCIGQIWLIKIKQNEHRNCNHVFRTFDCPKLWLKIFEKVGLIPDFGILVLWKPMSSSKFNILESWLEMLHFSILSWFEGVSSCLIVAMKLGEAYGWKLEEDSGNREF